MTHELYRAQDQLLDKIFTHLDTLKIPECILAGGTALARLYLHHRISYDLDFFIGNVFSPDQLAVRLGRIGVSMQGIELETGQKYVRQLHGYVNVAGVNVKISFIEDVYNEMWPKKTFGNVVTEEIGGLYHRKLRAISGNGYGRNTQGARQTARDLFDAYVLDSQIQPIFDFVQESNRNGANFPQESLSSNFLQMPWFDLIDEFENLALLSPYQQLSLIGDVKPSMIAQASMLQKLTEQDYPQPKG